MSDKFILSSSLNDLRNQWLSEPEYATLGMSSVYTLSQNKLDSILESAIKWGAIEALFHFAERIGDHTYRYQCEGMTYEEKSDDLFQYVLRLEKRAKEEVLHNMNHHE
jgi:hypothetical protein